MLKNRSIARRYFHFSTAISVVSLILLTGVICVSEYLEFSSASRKETESVAASHKSVIRSAAENAMAIISDQKTHMENRAKEKIVNRINIGLGILKNIYDKYNGKMTRKDLEALCADALNSIRFFRGRGYFFVFTLDGEPVIFPSWPKGGGEKIFELKDKDGRFVIKDMATLVKQVESGFYSYHWSKPEATDQWFWKISYVTEFKPFGWVVGAGEYLNDMELDIQNQTVHLLQQFDFLNKGHIFVGNMDKTAHPGQGLKNFTDTPAGIDPAMQKKFVRLAKTGGGYLEYKSRDNPDGPKVSKLAYIIPFPEWNWYIGAETATTGMERQLAQSLMSLRWSIIQNTLIMMVIVVVVAMASILVSRSFSNKLQSEFDSFHNYFSTAPTHLMPLDLSSLKSGDFIRLGKDANLMIESLRKSNAKLKKSLREKDILLKEVHHRVKNNLQIISSLIHLQEMNSGEALSRVLRDVNARISAIAMVHELLYRSENIELINFSDYAKRLASSLSGAFRSNAQVFFENHMEDLYLDVNKAVPAALMVNEAVTNAIKHAFPNRLDGIIRVTVEKNGPEGVIEIRDNGVGLPPGMEEEVGDSLGLQLMRSLARQLDGEMNMTVDNGTVIRLNFPAAQEVVSG